MQEITNYKALDGKIFTVKAQCIAYDKIVRQVRKIMMPFCDLPEDRDCRFANGGGYLQQNEKDVEKARKQITELGNKVFKIKPKSNFGFIGRYFGDSGYSCLYAAWRRLSNIDYKYREWGQGYYASNPTKGEQHPFIEKEDE